MYGKPEEVFFSHKEEIAALPRSRGYDKEHLNLYFAIEDFIASMENLSETRYYTHEGLLNICVSKISDNLLDKWQTKLADEKMILASTRTIDEERRGYWSTGIVARARTFSILEFKKFIEPQAVAVMGMVNKLGPAKSRSAPDRRVHVHQEDSQKRESRPADSRRQGPDGKRMPYCFHCRKESHVAADCRKLAAMPVEKRIKIVREGRICMGCLKSTSHGVSQCKTAKECGINGCKRRHHPLIHMETEAVQVAIHQTVAPKEVTRIMYKILPIAVKGPKGTVDTYAYLDDGSGCTFIEPALADEIGINGRNIHYNLNWTDGVKRPVKQSKLVSFTIKSKYDGSNYYIKEARTLALKLSPQTQLVNDLAEKDELQDASLIEYENATPRVLIGLDNAELIDNIERKRIGKDTDKLFLGTTLLGKVVYGKYRTQRHYDPDNNLLMLHHVDEETGLSTPSDSTEMSTVSIMMHQISEIEDRNSQRRAEIKRILALATRHWSQVLEEMIPRPLYRLPKFEGCCSEFVHFWETFVNTSRQYGYTSQEDNQRLSEALEGNALQIVHILLPDQRNIGKVTQRLWQFFGRPEDIFKSHRLKISLLTRSKGNDLKLLMLNSAMNSLIRSMKYLDREQYLYDIDLLMLCASKMPRELQNAWEKQGVPSHAQTPITAGEEKSYLEATYDRTSLPELQAFLEPHVEKTKKKICEPFCVYCRIEGHFATKCKRFISLRAPKRREIVELEKFCTGCIQTGLHNLENCKLAKTCQIGDCYEKHHRLLHKPRENEATMEALNEGEDAPQFENIRLMAHQVEEFEEEENEESQVATTGGIRSRRPLKLAFFILLALTFNQGLAGQIKPISEAGIFMAHEAKVYAQIGIVHWDINTGINMTRDKEYAREKLENLKQACNGVGQKDKSIEGFCQAQIKRTEIRVKHLFATPLRNKRSAGFIKKVWRFLWGNSESTEIEQLNYEQHAMKNLLNSTLSTFEGTQHKTEENIKKTARLASMALMHVAKEEANMNRTLTLEWINEISTLINTYLNEIETMYQSIRSKLGLFNDDEIGENMQRIKSHLNAQSTILPVNATVWRRISDQHIYQEEGIIKLQVEIPIVYKQEFELVKFVAIPDPETGKQIIINHNQICCNWEDKTYFYPNGVPVKISSDLYVYQNHRFLSAIEKPTCETATAFDIGTYKEKLCNKTKVFPQNLVTLIELPKTHQYIMSTDQSGVVEIECQNGYQEKSPDVKKKTVSAHVKMEAGCKLYSQGEFIIGNTDSQIRINKSALYFYPINVAKLNVTHEMVNEKDVIIQPDIHKKVRDLQVQLAAIPDDALHHRTTTLGASISALLLSTMAITAWIAYQLYRRMNKTGAASLKDVATATKPEDAPMTMPRWTLTESRIGHPSN
jgi:hypothetical protein